METNFASAIKGVIPALVITGFFITSRPSLCAEGGTGVIQMGPGMRAPSLEMVQTGLEDMLDRLGLTHAQREQVEQIMAGEALQLQPETHGTHDAENCEDRESCRGLLGSQPLSKSCEN